MNKKSGYNYASPAAAGLGLAVTGMALTNPVTAPFAASIGTMAAGFAAGVDLTDDEKTIKSKFDDSMNSTWHHILVDYRLTDDCLIELKQEVIGEETSTEEFVDNLKRKRLEKSFAMVIQTILERHRESLKYYSESTWDDEYIENASKEIASRLINTLKSVFQDDDLVKILKAIVDRSEDIRNDIRKSREANKIEHEQLMKVLREVIKVCNSELSLKAITDSEEEVIRTVKETGKWVADEVKHTLIPGEKLRKKNDGFDAYYEYIYKEFTYRKFGVDEELVGTYSDEEAYIDIFIWNGIRNISVFSQIEQWVFTKETKEVSLFGESNSKKTRCILLYGEPGHGKSTLCKKAVVDFCKGDFLKRKKKDDREIRNVIAVSLNTGDNPWIIENRKVVLENALAWGKNRQHTFTFEDCRGALLFLDGFDEFIYEAKAANISNIVHFMKLIDGIATEYDIHVVVLSRTTAIKDYMDHRAIKDRSYCLMPITEEQQNDWLDQHKEYNDYRETFNTLSQNKNMSALLGIPFLFRMIVYSRFNKISTNVVELYDKLIDHLMEKRNICGDDLEDVLERLRNLAYRVYCTDTDTAIVDKTEKDSQWFILFYIKQFDRGKVGFYHRSFYQYFLARHLYKSVLEVENNAEFFIGLLAERELDIDVRHYLSLMLNEQDKKLTDSNLKIVIDTLVKSEAYVNTENSASYGDAEKTRIGRMINIYRNCMHICAALSYVIQIPFKNGLDTFVRLFPSEGITLSYDDFIGADLSEANLQRADLCLATLNKANLHGADLIGANLKDASLEGTILSDAHLSMANMSGAKLYRADLRKADLTGSCLSLADLCESNLSGAILNKADLTESVLYNTFLDEAMLASALLSEAKFMNTQLNMTNLSEAKMNRVKLNASNLRESNMYGAILKEADLSGACLAACNLKRADLSGAVLRHADLKGADLSRANLYGADLSDADMTGAILVNTTLRYAVLTGANLSGADMTGADMTGAIQN